MTVLLLATALLSCLLFLLPHIRQPLSPLFLFGSLYGVGVVLRGSYLVLSGEVGLLEVAVLHNSDSHELLTVAFADLVFASFVVLVAYFTTSWTHVTEGIGRTEFLAIATSGSRQAGLLCLIGSASIALYLILGGSDYESTWDFVLALQARSIEPTAGKGYIGLLLDLGVICSIVVCAQALNAPREKKTAAAAALSAVGIGTTLALTGARGSLLQFFLSLLILRSVSQRAGHRYSRCAKQWSGALWAASLAAVVVPVGLGVRLAVQGSSPVGDSLTRVFHEWGRSVTSAFPLVDSFGLARVYATQQGYDYGLQFVEYLTRIVPRSLWPEKPLLLGLQIRQAFWGDGLSGIPPTLFGEFFISWGFVGLLFGAALLGMLLRLTSAFEKLALRDRRFVILYVSLVPFIFTLVRSGAEMAFMRVLVYTSIILILARAGFSGSPRVRIGVPPRTRPNPRAAYRGSCVGH